jgi:hypothetical protein
MTALRFLLGAHLDTGVKLNNRAWAFVAGRDFRPVGVRTYAGLDAKIGGGAVYFTPNTFYSWREKTKSALRWLNAIFADIDDPEMTMLDLLDRCWEGGLPHPSLVNKTPNGLHAYWKIEPVRATKKAVRLYSKLLRSVAAVVDGDPAAATPERQLRIPGNAVYYNPTVYVLRDFSDWQNENNENADTETPTPPLRTAGAVVAAEILGHPAVQKLLQGVEKGKRDNAAFTLALCYRAVGYDQEHALGELTAWNMRNKPPLMTPELQKAVKSAYGGKYQGPSADWIRELSGLDFKHRVIRERSGKPGKSGRPGKIQIAKQRLLLLLKLNHRGLRVRNQKQLAQILSVSVRTLQSVINDLGLKTKAIRAGKVRGLVYSLAQCWKILGRKNLQYMFLSLSVDIVQTRMKTEFLFSKMRILPLQPLGELVE